MVFSSQIFLFVFLPLVLLWSDHEKRVLAGVDLLGNLLRGIATGGAARIRRWKAFG